MRLLPGEAVALAVGSGLEIAGVPVILFSYAPILLLISLNKVQCSMLPYSSRISRI
jgi:hypothetical protein